MTKPDRIPNYQTRRTTARVNGLRIPLAALAPRRTRRASRLSQRGGSEFGLRVSAFGSGFFLGLAQAGNAVAGLPLAPFFEQFDPLETLEHIAFAPQGGRRAQTAML